MMYNDADDLVEKVLPTRVRRQFLGVFDTALQAYREFLSQNFKFLDTGLVSNINGRILSYAVDRQFLKQSQNFDFPFITVAKSVNNFNHQVVSVCKDDIVINIAKTKDESKLPAPSKYRLKNAQNNRFFNRQMIFKTDDYNNLTIGEPPYYCIVTYGIALDDLSHLNLFIPYEDLDGYYTKVDLLNEIHLVENEPIKDREVDIVTLKADLEKKYIKNQG